MHKYIGISGLTILILLGGALGIQTKRLDKAQQRAATAISQAEEYLGGLNDLNRLYDDLVALRETERRALVERAKTQAVINQGIKNDKEQATKTIPPEWGSTPVPESVRVLLEGSS